MRCGSVRAHTRHVHHLVPLRDLGIQIGPELGGRNSVYFELSDDLARNYCILVKRIHGTHSMVAICNDDLAIFFIPYQKERGKLMARENLFSILLHVRIADPQQG